MRKKNYVFMKLIMAVMLLTSSNAIYATGNFNIMLGSKTLKKNDWRPVESQLEYGFGFEIQSSESEWPIALVVTWLTSEASEIGDDIKRTGKTSEFDVGIRAYLIEGRVRFFIEGGQAFFSAKKATEGFGSPVSDSSSASGYWYGAGIDVMLNKALSIGLLGRISNAILTVGDVDGEIGGEHLNVFVAFHFGR